MRTSVDVLRAAACLAAACVVPACGNAPRAATAAPHPVDDGAGADAPPASTFAILGFALGATAGEVAASHPDLAIDPSVAEAAVVTPMPIAGIPFQLTALFRQDRLWGFRLDASGADATVDAFRRLVAAASADLGPTTTTRCESDAGEPFEDFLRAGHGLLEAAWPNGDVRARIDLRPQYGCGSWAPDLPACGLMLQAEFTYRPLEPPYSTPDDNLVEGVPSRGPARAETPGRSGPAKDADACGVDVSGMAGAGVLGVPFGSSRSEAERLAGGPIDDLGGGVGGIERELGGVPGRLQLHFYQNCLAVAIFVVEGDAVSVEAYRAVQRRARETIGSQGVAMRCRPEDAEGDLDELAGERGGLFETWRATAPLEGSLRLQPESGPEPAITLELDYVPLRPFAPEINFSP